MKTLLGVNSGFVLAMGCLVGAVATNLAVANVHATSDSGDPKIFRVSGESGADTPSGRLVLRMPAASDQSQTEGSPSGEGGEPPAEPNEGYPDEDSGDSSFFGEQVGGKAVFVIDVSLSMMITDCGAGEDWDGNAQGSMSRLAVVKTELINTLRSVEESFEFDIVWLAGGAHPCKPPNTEAWKGELVQCTRIVRDEAIEAVKNQTMWFGTPTWRALQRACFDYPDDLDVMIHLTDGEPFPYGGGEWGNMTHKEAVLDDFPVWYAAKKEYGCKLVGVHVGTLSKSRDFMEQWCAQNGATFVHR
ncbi:MAG: VWA domain-containing protein [Planctomycetaceae bacterium]|nr:VWA domain-containing protein [Planctomycetaceae bacterium]